MTNHRASLASPGTAVATRSDKANPIVAILGDRLHELAAGAFKGFTPEVIAEAALHASVVNPKILQSDPDSLFLALGKCARWGLNIGDEVHLVPYYNKRERKTICQAIPDYKGLKALCYRQRIATLIQEYVVYDSDVFRIRNGVPGVIEHEPSNPEQRKKIVGAWIKIHLPGGTATWHHMFIEEIERIRKESKQWGPDKVKVCPSWYAMKTVVRSWLNKQPKGGSEAGRLFTEIAQAEEVDFEVMNPDQDTQAGITEPMTEGPNVALPGDETKLGGYGGRPVVDAPRDVLERFVSWCHGGGERAERYAEALAVAEERLIELAANEAKEPVPA